MYPYGISDQAILQNTKARWQLPPGFFG